MRRQAFLLITLAAALAPRPSAAEELVCTEPHEIDRYQLLRRLSLDLRGQVPSIEEYEALDVEQAVPDEVIDAYLSSDDFRLAMRRYHEAFLWTNVSNVRLSANPAELRMNGPALRIQAGSKSNTFRGDSEATCQNFEHTAFIDNGPGQQYEGQFRPNVQNGEGWRWVTPYWDPQNPVKVCAFDAQETESVTLASGKVIACNTPEATSRAACGCGPNARFCYGPSDVSDGPIREAMREQLARAVDEVTVGGSAYVDLLLSSKAQQDGRIASWKRYLADNVAANLTWNLPDPGEEILDKDFTDGSWEQVERGGLHAGILTMPAYLLRFQTERARANRFRSAFQCQAFVPPDSVEDTGQCDPAAEDLTQRCSCRYCHATLEPMATSFGLFAEAGTTMMTDDVAFPLLRPDCVGSGNAFCRRFYVTQPDATNPGMLLAYQFASPENQYEQILDAGPRALAQSAIDDGSFAACAALRAFTHFVKRPPVEGAEDELITELAGNFEDSGWDFRRLVREVISLEQYRRAR